MPLTVTDNHGMLEDLLHCIICRDNYQDPKVLPCQHTFCKQCLQTMCDLDTHNNSRYTFMTRINCPTCRKKVLLPREGVDGLPADFKINQIQELLNNIDVTRKSQDTSQCEVCKYDEKEVPSEYYCVQCTKHLCNDCQIRHEQTPLFKDHSTICMDVANVSALECKEHKQEFKYYCTKCSEVLCMVCVLTKHPKHQTKDLAAATQGQQDDVKEKLDVLKQRLSEFEERSEQLERLKGAKERIYLTTQEAVKNQVQALIDIIHVNEQKILTELEDSHKTCMEQLSKEAENTEISIGNINSLYDFALSMTESSQSLQLMAVYNHLIERLVTMAEIKCSHIPSEIKYTHKFKPQDALLVGELSKLKLKRNKISTISDTNAGPVRPQANIRPGTLFGEGMYSTQSSDELGSPRQFVDVYSFAEHDSNMLHPQAENHINEEVANMDLLWKKHDLNSARDVAFLSNKSVVITEYQSRSEHIKLYDVTGNLLSKTIPKGRLDWMRPWGIVSSHQSNGGFHISDHRNFSIRTLDRQLSITHNIRTNLEKPTGIALSREGNYIVTDTSSAQQSVCIINPEGHTIREWGRPGPGDSQFNNPEFIVTDSHGRIIVSDNLNHCIKIFDSTGQFLSKFNKLGQGSPTMCNPEGVAVDVNDNILVANGGNVSLFSRDGEFICNFELPSNRRRRLSFLSDDRSYGIAVHPSGLLAVTAHSSLYVYSIPVLGYH